MKKWGFDPKIGFQESHSFSDVFLGSNAHFLTSYNHFLSSGSLFLINFMKFLRKGDILGENIAICLQTGGFWNYKLKKNLIYKSRTIKFLQVTSQAVGNFKKKFQTNRKIILASSSFFGILAFSKKIFLDFWKKIFCGNIFFC